MVRERSRNLFPNDVDYATERITAVHQSRRPTQHFHPIGRSGVGNDRMVTARVRHITGALSVFQHEHTVAAQATDHGPRCRRPHCGLSHPRLPIQSCRQRVVHPPVEVPATQDSYGPDQAFVLARYRAGNDGWREFDG